MIENPNNLPGLNFPPVALKLRQVDTTWKVFDPCREKFVNLSPEEWVRQHVIHFLIFHKHFPAGLIGVEKQLIMNMLTKRADLIVYNRAKVPVLLIECKAAHVPLDQAVLEQIARYNLVFKVKHLLVTNGLSHYFFKLDFLTEKIHLLGHFPSWDELNLDL